MNTPNQLPSRFQIGQPVILQFTGGANCGLEIHAYVRAVIFTGSKVRYSLLVPAGTPKDAVDPEELRARLNDEEPPAPTGIGFTLHNVDSCLLSPGQGEPIELGQDNYT